MVPPGRDARWVARSNSVRKRFPGVLLGVSFAGAALAVTSSARAQETANEFSSQRFDAPAGPRNYITTRGARTDGEMAWSAGFVVSYAYKPLVVESCVDPSAVDCEGSNALVLNVVENIVQGDLLGSFTPTPRLQIGLRVPAVFVKGQGIDRTSPDPASLGTDNPIEAVGLGDPELEAKVRAYGEPKDVVVAGAALYVTAPLGHATAPDAFIGDETPGVGLRLIFDGEAGQFSFGGNIGGVLRGSGGLASRALASETKVGSELRYSVAAGWRPSPVLRAVVDMFGSTRLSTVGGENALELDGGVQAGPFGSLTIQGGAGTSLIHGVGTPDLRVFAGFVYALEKRDRDDDALDDSDDQCPTEPEDRDGYEDADGCPDPDNDLDSLPDKSDKCPGQAEDVDSFEDTDGCPELDNDKDGVADTGDRCVNEPETKNGFDDEDGCPDVTDNDRDGVPDDKDACPDNAEDTDGFEDTDGCADPDNDKDGLPDNQDECVDEPETVNQFEDGDGCPDEKPKR
jgi:OOP family OmpA-OmpF porin